TAIANGAVEVKFKSLAGNDDQAAGLIWRWKDGDNYYVARADALEKEVSLSYIKQGERHTLRTAQARVMGGVRHALRGEVNGARLRILLDGEARIDIEDEHISGPGSVGVWTQSDSVTAFDDFGYRAEP